MSEREDISLGAYQATGCGEVAIFRCHEGAGGIVDCTPDGPATEEQPAPGAPPQAAQPSKASASSVPDVTGNGNSNSKYDPLNGSLK